MARRVRPTSKIILVKFKTIIPANDSLRQYGVKFTLQSEISNNAFYTHWRKLV